jgi:hypothetical protein
VKRKVKQSRHGFVNQIIEKLQNRRPAKIDGASHSRVGDTAAISGSPLHLGVNLSSPDASIDDKFPCTPELETFDHHSYQAELPELDGTQPAKELDGSEIGSRPMQSAAGKATSDVEKHTQAAQAELLRLDSLEISKRSA